MPFNLFIPFKNSSSKTILIFREGSEGRNGKTEGGRGSFLQFQKYIYRYISPMKQSVGGRGIGGNRETHSIVKLKEYPSSEFKEVGLAHWVRKS